MDVNEFYAPSLQNHHDVRHSTSNGTECECFRRGWAAATPSRYEVSDVLTVEDTLFDVAYLDECATRAMEAFLSYPLSVSPDELIEKAWRVADRMLAERKRRREGGA